MLTPAAPPADRHRPTSAGPDRARGRALDAAVMPLALRLAFWALLTCAVAWALVPRAEHLARTAT